MFLLLAASAAGAQTIRQRASWMNETERDKMCQTTADAGSPDAIEWCTIALEDRALPGQIGLRHAYRAMAYEKAGNNEAALADLNEAFRLVDNDRVALVVLDMRARLLYKVRNYAAAVQDFTDLLRYEASKAGHWHNRGMAHYRMGNWDLAIQDYSQRLRLEPASTESLYWRAQAYAQKKLWDQAIADYDQVLRLDSSHAAAFSARGVAYGIGKADYPRGISDLLEFSRLRPNDPAGPYGRGLLLEMAGDFDRARQEYEAALRLDPNHFDARQGRQRAEEMAKTAARGPEAPTVASNAGSTTAAVAPSKAPAARWVLFSENEKTYGYMDPSGRVAIPAWFRDLHEFSEGLAFARDGRSSGFINRDGAFVFRETSSRQGIISAKPYSEGLAAACLHEPRQTSILCRWHYIDPTGKVVIRTALADSTRGLFHPPAFHQGLAATDDGSGKLAYMDKTGALVIRTNFSAAYLASEYASKDFKFTGNLGAVCAEGLSVDADGRPDSCSKWGYIDRTGKLVIPAELWSPLEFSEGLAVLSVGGKKGYIDTDGKLVIAAQFDEAFAFFDGIAEVAVNKKPVLIDKTGKVLCALPTTNSGSIHFSQGLSPFATSVKGGFKYGFVDRACRVVIPAKFDGAREFSEGLAAFQQGDKWGFIDKSGKIVIPAQFQMPDPFQGGLAQVTGDEGFFAYIDHSGKLLKPRGGSMPNAAASAQPASTPPAATTTAETPKPAEPNAAQQATTYLAKAHELIRKGDFAGAVTAQREVVRLQPDDIGHRLSLASNLLDAGQFAEAIPEIEMVVARFPGVYWHRFALSQALAGAGRKSEALAQLDLAAKAGAAPADVRAEREKMLGREAAAKGDYAAAILHFLKANEFAADGLWSRGKLDVRIQIQLAVALARIGQTETALKSLDQAAASEQFKHSLVIPPAREKLVAEIESLKAAGTPAAAASPAAAAITAYANAELAAQSNKKGRDAAVWDPAAAVVPLKEAVRLAPDNHSYQFDLGNSLAKAGAFAEAIPHYQKAVELRPEEAWYHMHLAQALAGTGQKEAALQEADKAVAARPDWATIRQARDELIAKLQSGSTAK
jgi:tetratricopeptide (TPR) repeat protein